jgi:hypothetical protein
MSSTSGRKIVTQPPCVVSVADHAGWAHIVCVGAADGAPAVVERRRVPTLEAGLPTMPYHHESLGMDVDEADALVARVRESIAACSSRALREIVNDLAPFYSVVALAIREPSFPELPATVVAVRQSYQLQCAADGLMYLFAWRDAARSLGLDVSQYRRGGEASQAAARLGVSPEDVETFVNGTGRPAGPPWTEEHRRAYAAGIAELAARTPLHINVQTL